MQTLRIKDIIGPIMVGPSSSHTAGALRIASMVRQLCPETPTDVEFKLYGSFAHTYRGHGTDRALCAGMLGLHADDLRIRDSLELARNKGMHVVFTPLPDEPCDHPNTVDIEARTPDGALLSVRGESIGGGAAVLRRINGIDLSITGEHASAVVRQHDEKGVLAHIAQSFNAFGINIATARMFRERRGEMAYTVLETDSPIPSGVRDAILTHPGIVDVRVIPADDSFASEGYAEPDITAIDRFEKLDFASGEELLAYCTQHSCSIAEAFRARETALCESMGRKDDLDAYLVRTRDVMRESATAPAKNPEPTMGGLIGGESTALTKLHDIKGGICESQLAHVSAYALGVLETNASMGRIVAAPTAGSSGVLPAVLLVLREEHRYDDHMMNDALVCAAAIGYLIARNATVSGAEGGCQAEIGAAAAMAAAAAAQLATGTPRQCFDAAANVLSNLMGLVCDPIAGLVEVPCQKRNASAAACALVSAEISLAGIENLVDFDQTVQAMFKVGRSLPFELRESALGGIAAEPAACAWCREFKDRG